MLELLAVLVAALVGFTGSRAVRHSLAVRTRPAGPVRPQPAHPRDGFPPGPVRPDVPAQPLPPASPAPPRRPPPPSPPGATRPTVATVGGAPGPAAPAPAAAQEASLARTDGDHRERFALVTDVVTVGRSADQDISVPEVRVSRHHGTFQRTGAGWTYTDDGSSNGSRINGRPLAAGQPVALRHGDRVDVGSATFVFRQLGTR